MLLIFRLLLYNCGKAIQKKSPLHKNDNLTYDTSQALISELHWFSRWQFLLLQKIPEQLVLSSLSSFSLSSLVILLWDLRGDCSLPPSFSTSGHGSSSQVHEGMGTDGNGVQERGHTTSEETDATRFLLISDLQVSGEPKRRGWEMHDVHKFRVRFCLSSFEDAVGSLTNEMIPLRHRGHGIDPGGPTISDVMLLVEQR